MIKDSIITTKRLYLEALNESDMHGLKSMLQDPDVMYAYEGAFSDKEVDEWYKRQLSRYEEYGFGLWAVKIKTSDEFIGQCGITMQSCNGKLVPEIGYLLRKEFWHKGYATEAAKACMAYGFSKLGFTELFSIIRDGNIASMRVAERNGMTITGYCVKHFKGIDMRHTIYSIKSAVAVI